ncbi:MAG: leucyl aminopeptidase family protein [Armatimonadetes bacterium]|nr:leucyl aminopeptidase family protein [Armatimonadota bacterium]
MFRSVSVRREAVSDLVVRFVRKGSEAPATWPSESVEAVARAEFQGDAGQTVESFPHGSPRELVLGLGDAPDDRPDALLKAFSSAARRIAAMKVRAVSIDSTEIRGAGLHQAIGEAFGLLSWTMDEFLGSGSERRDAVDLAVWADDGDFDRELERGLALAASTNWARTLTATPPNVATPEWMSAQAVRLADQGLDVRVLDGEELRTERLAGLINVGKASANKPCFIRIAYQPEGTMGGEPVVLLGKTVTYDTGGLAIKSREGMKGMKGDKAGGCAVLGAMHAVATVLRPSFPVVGILVAAENSIGPDAFRNDDVLTFRNGVTVEVTNTDAEGRLVLADGLCWAADCETPRCVIDLATLTGGVVVALGGVFAGLFSNDDALAGALSEAGAATGERLWRLPLDKEYESYLKSPVADVVNSAASRGAHPVMGATFLSKFVPDGTSWAHIDIAGVAQTDADKGPFTAGPTGFGVRLLARYLEQTA